MRDNRDYYEILSVNPNASFEEIKEAYRFLVNIYHPDRLSLMSENIRKRAEDELKLINTAYTTLSNPINRSQYDSKINVHTTMARQPHKAEVSKKPIPEIYPKTIKFDNARPYIKQQGAFFIRNTGGAFDKVMISKTPDWIKIVETKSLYGTAKLPMEVKIEVVGIHWGKTIKSQIAVRLDEVEAKVNIELSTIKEQR